MLSTKTNTNRLVKFVRMLIPDVVVIISGPLKGSRWCSKAGSQGFWLGTYEREKQEEFFALVKRGNTVFDIGANTGLYTLLAAKALGDKGQVYSFEPSQRNLEFLRRHITLNKIGNATVFPCAIAAKSGEAFFDQGENHATGHLSKKGQIAVNVVTVDELVETGQVIAPSILKIDVEGAETSVLKGAITVLNQARPIVFLAIHGSKQHEECCDILTSANYRIEVSNEQYNIQFGSLSFDYLAEILAYPN